MVIDLCFIGIFISFVISILFSNYFSLFLIPVFKKLQFENKMRENKFISLHDRIGTPTGGGVIFVISTSITILLMLYLHILKLNSILIVLICFFIFSLLGFVDDIFKIIRPNPYVGFKSPQKIVILIIASFCLTIYFYKYIGSEIYIPFKNDYLDIGSLYIPFTSIFVFCSFNALSVTSFSDTLSIIIPLIILFFLTILCFFLGKYELAIFCIALSGSLVGFIKYTYYTFKIHIGHITVLSLGGTISTISILLKMEILLLIMCGIYIILALTTFIRVYYFKLTKKIILKSSMFYTYSFSKRNHVKLIVFSIITIILSSLSIFLFISYK